MKPGERFQILHFLCDCAAGLEQFRDVVDERQKEYRTHHKELTDRGKEIKQPNGGYIPQRQRKIKGAFIKRLFQKKESEKSDDKEPSADAAMASAGQPGLTGQQISGSGTGANAAEQKSDGKEAVGSDAKPEPVVFEKVPNIIFHEITQKWYSS